MHVLANTSKSHPMRMGSTRPTSALTYSTRDHPTCMGSTRCFLQSPSSPGGHPHTHGEHSEASAREARAQGSSPYAWGAHDRAVGVRVLLGIIPIRMGSTIHKLMCPNRVPDHPHTHGEHPDGSRAACFYRGSSPYAWGAQLFTSHLTMNSPSFASRSRPPVTPTQK